jgi:hypothetical protein
MGKYELLVPGSLPYAHVTETKYCGEFLKNPGFEQVRDEADEDSIWITDCKTSPTAAAAVACSAGASPLSLFIIDVFIIFVFVCSVDCCL